MARSRSRSRARTGSRSKSRSVSRASSPGEERGNSADRSFSRSQSRDERSRSCSVSGGSRDTPSPARSERGRNRTRQGSPRESERRRESANPSSRKKTSSKGASRDGDEDDNTGSEEGAVIKLCSTHGNSLRPDICNACNHLGKIIQPSMMSELTKTSEELEEGEIPSASKRFSRADEVPPTLIFSASSMELAAKVFSLGRYKSPKYFEELTKGWLLLPSAQHDLLNGNISLENLFKKYEHDNKFSHIFSFKNQAAKCHRDLRITIRILIIVQDHLDKLLLEGKAAARKLGFVFPVSPPEVSVLGPKHHTNLLAYQSLPTFKDSSGTVSTLVLPAPVGILDNCKNITQVQLFLCFLR